MIISDNLRKKKEEAFKAIGNNKILYIFRPSMKGLSSKGISVVIYGSEIESRAKEIKG